MSGQTKQSKRDNQMKITTLLTADHASVEQATGKVHILGAFTRIFAEQFPCIHRRMAVVIKLRPDLGDHANERELALVLKDENGIELMRFSVPFTFNYGDLGVRPEFNAVLELNNLHFPKAGLYEFEVYVDDQLQGGTSIELIEVAGK
jgi:hypothetical protein